MKSKKRKGWLITGILVIAVIIGSSIYVNDYYHALPEALTVIEQVYEGISITETENKQIVFAPENPKAGVIFYPGGKVQYEAYAPLMTELAQQGILCVLLHMPANLAVLDMNAADGIREQFGEVEDWYIAGHSLGGSMAASYAGSNTDEFEGLILLAAYSTKDLKDSGLKILSVYGSEDGVLNMEKYEENLENLPEDFNEVIIEGGNHAFFGMYGFQDGDENANITNKAQIQAVAEIIMEYIAE